VIANRLSRMMGERRVSIQELARQSGVSYSTLHDFYHDRLKRFDRDVLDRLCRTFDCTVGTILEYVPGPVDADGRAVKVP
jgi:putative transcriptional regulator